MSMMHNYTNINYEYQKYFMQYMKNYIIQDNIIKFDRNTFIPNDENIYFINDGLIRQFFLDEDGKEKTFLVLGKGDFFGEVTYFQQDNNLAFSETILASSILIVDKMKWENVFLKDIEFYKNLTESLSMKVKILLYQLYDASYLDVKARILNFLLRMAIQKGKKVKGGYQLSFELSHQDIARTANCTRENATKRINELIEEDLLSKKGKYYIISEKAYSTIN